MKTPLTCFFPILIAGMLVTASFAERVELLPPEPLTFDPREHMKPEYRDAVDALCRGAGDRPLAVTSLCETLSRTLNQEKLLEALQEALDGLPAGNRWMQRTQELNEMVGGGMYVLTVPVEFRKLETGGWEVRWREWNDETRRWSGPYEIRRVSPIPEMHFLVEALIVSEEGSFRFGYTIRNRPPGEESVTHIFLDAVGLTLGRSMLLRAGYGRREFGGLGYLILEPKAGGYLRLFSFWAFDGMLSDPGRPARPGETLVLPPLLEVPWRALPGVIRCWVEPLGWHSPTGLSGEMDPEDVSAMVAWGRWENTQLGRKKTPRWACHGKTVGPVPAPTARTPRRQWVDQLVAWHAEARKWGWYDNGGEKLWETRAAELQADAGDDRIRDLLAKVEEDRQAGRLLEETYAIWRYNLEYLLKMPQPGE